MKNREAEAQEAFNRLNPTTDTVKYSPEEAIFNELSKIVKEYVYNDVEFSIGLHAQIRKRKSKIK